MKTLNAAVALLLGLAAWPQAGRCAPTVTAEPALVSALQEAHTQVATWKILDPKPQPVFKAGFSLALNAPDKDWQAILTKLRNKGKYAAAYITMPARFQLADVRGPMSAAHTEDSVEIWGEADDAGVFHPQCVLFTSQDWMVDATNRNWHIDEWIYIVDLYGEITKVTHSMTVESADHQVLKSDEPEVLDNASPAVQDKYKALIKFWSEFQPQETNQ